jgi:glycerate kinase
MSDVEGGEAVEAVEALKAAFRGTLRASESLGPLRERVEALTEMRKPDEELLSELASASAGLAVAAAAVRSLSETLSQKARPEPS